MSLKVVISYTIKPVGEEIGWHGVTKIGYTKIDTSFCNKKDLPFNEW